MAKITVLGSGGWGTALALSAFNNNHEVTLWSPFEAEIEMLNRDRSNEKLLPGIIIPKEITITNDLSCVEGSAMTIIATPSIAIREVAKKLSSHKDFGIVVNVAKGFEKSSLKRLSVVIKEEVPHAKVLTLSGPSHAEEVARKIPTSLVCAGDDHETAEVVQELLSNEFLRVYTATDIIGVELGGALKNIIAVAAGFCDGMGLGDNTKAALMTRGINEMSRLGVCMGADERTFAGLSGIGDLIVTCTSAHSRNNRFGNKIGKGMDVETALKEVGTVEGYYASLIAYELGKKYEIDLPIINECYELLYQNRDANSVVHDLMTRPTRKEQ